MWSGEAAADGTVVARWLFTDRGAIGASAFSELNLADHVGDSPESVAGNRERVLRVLDRHPAEAAWPRFCHSNRVAWVDAGGEAGDVDALVTDVPGVVLTALGADCVPLVAVEPRRRLVCSAHIGWRGAADGLVERLLDSVESHGGDLSALEVWLGPSICGDCYRVPVDRRAAVAAVLPEAEVGEGLDLRRGISARLLEAGASVNLVGPCTFESERLFSYRRDGQTGRQAAFVVLL